MIKAILAGSLLLLSQACAQTSSQSVLTVVPGDHVVQAKLGSKVNVKVDLELQQGFHVNSNTPSEDFLIPLKLTWNPAPMIPVQTLYPKPSMERYSFSKVPLSVFTGGFSVNTSFDVPRNAKLGPAPLTGKLRFQACNDRMCLPPRSVDVKLRVNVVP